MTDQSIYRAPESFVLATAQKAAQEPGPPIRCGPCPPAPSSIQIDWPGRNNALARINSDDVPNAECRQSAIGAGRRDPFPGSQVEEFPT